MGSRNEDFYRSKSSAPIWKYFHRNITETHAKCMFKEDSDDDTQPCGVVYVTTNSATSSLRSHMEKVHKIKVPLKKDEKSETASGANKQPKMDVFYAPKQTYEDLITELTITLEIPFAKLCHPIFLDIFARLGYKSAHKSPNTIRNLVVDAAKRQTEKCIEEIATARKTQQVGISMDEWTSTANKKYSTIIVHLNDKRWNLGLFRIHGRHTASDFVRSVTDVLSGHSINIKKDVSGISTDGASVMVKMGM